LVGDDVVATSGRVMLVAVGKAAAAMTAGAIEALGDLVSGGFVITKDGHGDAPPWPGVAIREASHPIPDERGVAATEELLALLAGLGPDDVVIALISGGGSALLEAPRPPATLADLAIVTDLLLRAGAPIQDLNAVRRALSRVKAGGLRRAAPEAKFITLLLSDVLGNDPRVIASGPTVQGNPEPALALEILDRYGVRDQTPPAILDALAQAPAAGGDAAPNWSGDIVRVVADNDTAIEAASDSAIGDGLSLEVYWRQRSGEAADLGRAWVEACRETLPEVDALIGGGEATVTVRGDGRGGRNTEFALAAALALAAAHDVEWVVASLATDGQDGPTDVAGAIADGLTVERARAAGVDPAAALARNDSLRVFEAAGGVVAPGPTGTNVNDLYLAVRRSALSRFGG
jgi:hydroxypyruvate reductase